MNRLNLIIVELLLISISLIIDNAYSQCSWTVDGHTIDLSSLSSSTLSWTDSATSFQYKYTPCRNGLTCTDDAGVSVSAMSTQAKTTNTFCTAYLATWDSSVKPSYSNGVFTFSYANGKSSGACSSGRELIAKWSCGSSSTPSVSSVATDSGGCDYTMSISWDSACSGGSDSSSSDEDGDLSVGSIMLIVIASAVFLYCVIGYIICAKKNPENGWGNVKANTPHLSFWCLVPKWTWAGCCVTKEFTMNKYNELRAKTGGGAGGGYDTVADE